MPTEQPLAYILVLHWRGLEHTRACLTSLRAIEYANCRVLLVDNGSENSDGATLNLEYPEIEVLPLSENRGFSGGCNAGIDYCLQHQAAYIWVLNNDTTVRPDSLSLLVSAAEQNQKAAALSAAVLDSIPAHGEEKLIPGRGILDFVRGKSLLKETRGDLPITCEWLAASNLLLRARALDGKEAFDERYFLYFEDTELCHRLTLQGWQCLLVPRARINHVGNASTGENLQHWRAYYYTRNRMLFFATYARFPMNIFCMLSIHGHLLRHRFSLPRKGENGVRQLQAELLGLKDFQRRRFGKCLELH